MDEGMVLIIGLLVFAFVVYSLLSPTHEGMKAPLARCDERDLPHKWVYDQNGKLKCDACNIVPKFNARGD